MFGNLGQIANLLKNAGQIKENMQAMQQRLEAARFVGEAGGGQVRATINGKLELLEVKIEPALVAGGDVEMIEDLTCSAVRAAITLSREGAEKELRAATGGLDLQSMMNMLGG